MSVKVSTNITCERKNLLIFWNTKCCVVVVSMLSLITKKKNERRNKLKIK